MIYVYFRSFIILSSSISSSLRFPEISLLGLFIPALKMSDCHFCISTYFFSIRLLRESSSSCTESGWFFSYSLLFSSACKRYMTNASFVFPLNPQSSFCCKKNWWAYVFNWIGFLVGCFFGAAAFFLLFRLVWPSSVSSSLVVISDGSILWWYGTWASLFPVRGSIILLDEMDSIVLSWGILAWTTLKLVCALLQIDKVMQMVYEMQIRVIRLETFFQLFVVITKFAVINVTERLRDWNNLLMIWF